MGWTKADKAGQSAANSLAGMAKYGRNAENVRRRCRPNATPKKENFLHVMILTRKPPPVILSA